MKTDVRAYIATKMTGLNKDDIVARAKRVCEIMTEAGITPISPVIEEHVKDEPVKLINDDKVRLLGFWKRDKEILIKEAHVMLWDHAEQKSFGAEREMALMRFCLWKPLVIYVPPGTPTSVAPFEDDAVFTSVHAAAKYIVDNWGTGHKRRVWRLRMLMRTFPQWVWRQILGWR